MSEPRQLDVDNDGQVKGVAASLGWGRDKLPLEARDKLPQEEPAGRRVAFSESERLVCLKVFGAVRHGKPDLYAPKLFSKVKRPN